MASISSRRSRIRSFEQVRAAARSLFEQADRVSRLGVLAEHDDADLGVGSRAAAARSGSPRRAPDGGIRMSVTTTSGTHVSIAFWSSLPFVQTATSSTLGDALSTAVRNSRITYESSATMTRIGLEASSPAGRAAGIHFLAGGPHCCSYAYPAFHIVAEIVLTDRAKRKGVRPPAGSRHAPQSGR